MECSTRVSGLCWENGRSSTSFYKWRAKFGGTVASLIAEMSYMVEQNRRSRKMYAEKSMQNDLLKEALESATCCAIGPSDNGAQ